jgi:peptidoglycan/xylan/chitin deacetylase (PgdA/CDA1 family)
MSSRTIPVLMYHRVCRDEDWTPCDFLVSVSTFRHQMRYLARHRFYTPPVFEIVANCGRRNGARSAQLPSSRRRSGSPIVITFDDGYRDNLDLAVPVLQEFGFAALFFLVTDFSYQVNWWDELPELRAALIKPPCICALKQAGMEIGSHSITHRSLAALDADELRHELRTSKRTLEDLIQEPVRSVSYPYGDVNDAIKSAAREVGYECGFAGNSGPLTLCSDLFEIRRLRVCNQSNDRYMFWLVSGLAQRYDYGKSFVKQLLGIANPYHAEKAVTTVDSTG